MISVIIPVYNVQNYIKKCLESIINQTYKNLEIIIVNDGSTDNSLKICEEYAQKDNRIRIFNKENGGVSSARNFGLKNANGKYIGFIDSDDVVNLNMYEVLHNAMTNSNVDLCVCNQHANKIVSQRDLISALINEEKGAINTQSVRGVVFYLYKRNIINKNNIHFNTEIKIGEDMLFNINYLLFVENIQLVEQKLYSYEVRSGSAMTSYNSNYFLNYIILQNNIVSLLNNSLIDSKKLEIMFVKHFITCISNEFKQDNPQKKQIKNTLKKFLNSKEIIEIRDSLNIGLYEKKFMIDILCIKYNNYFVLYWYRKIYYILKKKRNYIMLLKN